MKREEFIREIEENLSGKMTEQEIQDVMYDYNEYFDVGIREGRSEEDLCGQWGSPAIIVKTLLAEGTENTVINKATCSGFQSLDEVVEGRKLDYALLPHRLLAFFIDTIIAGLPMALVTKAFSAFLTMPFTPTVIFLISKVNRLTPTPEAPQFQVIYAMTAVAFFCLYQPLCLFLLRGQTIGKLIMEIKVVRQDGSSLTVANIFAREVLGKLIFNTLSFGIASLISFVWTLLSREHKTLHDEIGGTRVVNAETYQKGQ